MKKKFRVVKNFKLNPSMALHKKEESVYLKKNFVFTSRGPLIVRTISWAVDFSYNFAPPPLDAPLEIQSLNGI